MVNCAGSPPPVSNESSTQVKPADWAPGTQTILEQLAAKRSQALSAQAALYQSIDPLQQWAKEQAMRSQEVWESIVFDAGKRATLSPFKSRNIESWLANWLGIKSASMGLVREPLLNVKRITEGFMREAAIYGAIYDSRQLAKEFRETAKRVGAEFQQDDVRRLIEEGMTPQRLDVYGNTPNQVAELATRYSTWASEMMQRGFTQLDIDHLLQSAQNVSKHFDELRAVQLATGMDIGAMHNIGMFPRQFTEDGFTAAKLAGALGDTSTQGLEAAAAKSRSTWQYLPEDHGLAAHLMGISGSELHALIANPVDFAIFLSQKFAGQTDKLDLLVESGVMSKIPMLTSHVEEYLSKVYKIPMLADGLFEADPIKASAQVIQKMRIATESSAMIKYIEREGLQAGWAIPAKLQAADPAFKNYIRLADVPEIGKYAMSDSYAHPSVVAHLQGVARLSNSPGLLGEASQGYNMFTKWFAKQALGNPLPSASAPYLFGQYMGNMLAAFSRGVAPRHYIASVIDLVRVATQGLEALDDVKPFRIIDGQAFTHRELVRRSLRMFNRELIPGLTVSGTSAIDFKKLNPLYTINQLQQLAQAAQTTGGYAAEVAKLMAGKADGVLTPVLQIAQLLDLAGQLAIIRGKSRLGTNDLGDWAQGVEQLAMGWSIGKLDSWDDLVLEVKRGMPMFDDIGRVPAAIAKLVPFSSWAIANAPLQLKSMMREPHRWYNYVRAHAAWNTAHLPTDPTQQPLNGEMQDWERDNYGMVLQFDPVARRTHMLFTANFDPRWGVWAKLASASDQTPKPLRDGTRESSGAKMLRQLIGSTYFAGTYEALSGINPLTGVRTRDTEYTSAQFANIPMPVWMAGILSISPVLESVNRMDAVSGTRDVLDPRTGEIARQATLGWLGNRGTKMPQHKLEGVEAMLQTIGGRVRVIDGLAAMQYTESETRTAISKMISESFAQQKQLATDVRNGSLKRDSEEYRRRERTINSMIDTALQVNIDLKRIEAYAVVNRLPSRDMLQTMRDRKLSMDRMPLPSADYIQEQITKAQRAKER